MKLTKEPILLFGYFLYKLMFCRTVTDARIDFIDVGQGDAILVTTSSGNRVLVDGGSDYELDSYISESMLFSPCHLDAIVLTHPHSDHLVGLNRLLQRCSVSIVFFNKLEYVTGDYAEFLKLSAGTKTATLQQNDEFAVGEAVFKVLWPVSAATTQYKDINDASIVLLLTLKKQTILLTGDASSTPLLSFEPLLPELDIVKVSHHGSKTAFAKKLYLNHNPKSVVLQVGKNNFYHLPNDSVMNFLIEQRYKVYRTDHDGNITFIF